MTIAWEFIQAMVAASRSVRQSHRTLPLGVLIRIARWPMASLGVVMMDQKLGFESIWDQVLEYLGVSWEREVHFWPVGGTYWRGSCVGQLGSLFMHPMHGRVVSYCAGKDTRECVKRTSQITQFSKGSSASWSNSVPHATQTRRSGLSGDVVDMVSRLVSQQVR